LAKIIFLTSRFPYPLNKGDKLRVYFQLKHLAEANEIHLIAVNDTEVSESHFQELMPFCKSIHVFVLPLYKRIFQLLISPLKGMPLQVAFFYSKGIKKQVVKLTNEIKPDHIHCHLIRTTEYVKEINTFRKSVDFMDAFGKGLEKRQISEQNVFKRYLYAYEKRLVYKYETKVFAFIDKFIIISEQDKSFIKSKRVNEIVVIPNGVDFNTFYPKSTEKLYDLLFMGNLSYPPNIDAVKFFASEILPLLKNQML
jgi:glycosyltransferase involved in cell wall biosynthesis